MTDDVAEDYPPLSLMTCTAFSLRRAMHCTRSRTYNVYSVELSTQKQQSLCTNLVPYGYIMDDQWVRSCSTCTHGTDWFLVPPLSSGLEAEDSLALPWIYIRMCKATGSFRPLSRQLASILYIMYMYLPYRCVFMKLAPGNQFTEMR